jgi:hypothetical protein
VLKRPVAARRLSEARRQSGSNWLALGTPDFAQGNACLGFVWASQPSRRSLIPPKRRSREGGPPIRILAKADPAEAKRDSSLCEGGRHFEFRASAGQARLRPGQCLPGLRLGKPARASPHHFATTTGAVVIGRLADRANAPPSARRA